MTEYIDKQVVIDEVDEWYDLYPDSDTAREALSLLKKAIKKISSEDVRPMVRGRWIDYDDDYGAYCCSVCEQDAPEDTEWPYCPNCGAYMCCEG
jgi:hypothetical protein